jgi:hypothetical protein
MLGKVLVDGRAKTNVMIILVMRYLRLEIDKPTLVTLKMANKQIIKPKGVVNNVAITIMKASTSGFPCNIRGKWGLPNNIR